MFVIWEAALPPTACAICAFGGVRRDVQHHILGSVFRRRAGTAVGCFVVRYCVSRVFFFSP